MNTGHDYRNLSSILSLLYIITSAEVWCLLASGAYEGKKIARKVPGLLGKRDLGALVFKYSSLVCAGFSIKLGKMEPTIRSAV